ncbi:GMC family oxidoreductase [Mucilaginibacter sp. PPCGB 2223]|uniref:GMC family oxidoreductase n=1 Tax=Mucilaginibacter sp. PPCGB 2223 TaxID=1886027 RepID=UPI0009F31C6C|nr:GMC family oxidoreductase [Mucilaginibacter sp. PPCGB 2223]
MKTDHYDVVIAGSGIAGSLIAKTLTRAGKKVLLLEAGLQAGVALDSDGAYNNYMSYLDRFYNAAAKVPNSPYPILKDAPTSNVLDVVKLTPGGPPPPGYLVQMGPLPFASDAVRGPGGTMLHWLGTTLRMLPNDFKMKTVYNQAVDWPITADDLRPYYEMAELEIGVSGEVSEQTYPDTPAPKAYFGKDYVFPMHKIPQSYLDTEIAKGVQNMTVKLNKRQYKINCISTPQGRNSTPNAKYPYRDVIWNKAEKKLKLTGLLGEKYDYNPVPSIWDAYTGQRCEGNASCVPICPVQAKYNPLKTLKRSNFDHLTIITQAVASTINIDEKTKEVTGIVYKRYNNPDSPEYTTGVAAGKIYVLAANAIENAKILLASGAANSSDQVGRNLMDHMVMLTWGLTKEKIYPYRGPGSTTNIATFRDGPFRSEHAAWISPFDNWGWSWPVFSPGSDVSDGLAMGLFGKQLRDYLNERLTRQFLLHFECEQSPDPDNRVTIDHQYLDPLGNYKPIIHYYATDYMLKSMEAAKTVSDQIFAANGIEDHTVYNPVTDAGYVTYKGQGYTYRGAGHIVGTHRMGFNKHDSVVNHEQRTWDHPNLFLAGCGNMPTLGTSNPSLTMTALTFKAAEAILKQLEK